VNTAISDICFDSGGLRIDYLSLNCKFKLK